MFSERLFENRHENVVDEFNGGRVDANRGSFHQRKRREETDDVGVSKDGFEHVLDERSWDEEKKEFRTIFVNDTDDISQEDKYANNSNKKRIPNGVTAGGLFKLLEHFDAYIEKDVKLTEEGVGAEFLIATLAMPIALYYSGLKTVPKYATET